MVLTDVRSMVLGYFNPSGATVDGTLVSSCKVIDSNLLLEDNLTRAKFEAQFMGEDDSVDLEDMFGQSPDGHGLDVLFMISEGPTWMESFNTPSGVIGYTYTVRVQGGMIDKRSSTSSLSVYAQKLLWKVAQEIERVLRTNMTGSMRVLSGGVSASAKLGSMGVYTDVFEVKYFQEVTYY